MTTRDVNALSLDELRNLVHAQAQQLEELTERRDHWYAVAESHNKRAAEHWGDALRLGRELKEQAQQIEALRGELRQIDQVLARRPAVATEPTRASAVEKACFVAGQQSDRANRLEHEVERLKRQIVPLPDPPVASPPIADLQKEPKA